MLLRVLISTFLSGFYLGLAGVASAHGVIRNPPSRVLGPAMTKLCGQTAFDIARGDVTASLETVAPNITAGCQYCCCPLI